MNQYTTGMRSAVTLAQQVIRLKNNRFLDQIGGLSLDSGAFVPRVHSWTHFRGFRAKDADSASALLSRAVHQWIRSSYTMGVSAVFVLQADRSGNISVHYGNMDPNAVLNAALPDCSTVSCDIRHMEGCRFSGITLGTLASENIANSFASGGFRGAYIACIIVPVADSAAQDLLTENRRLTAALTPYQSIQRVYGNASRKTVEISVQEVGEALAILRGENAFLQRSLPDGLVCAAVRFGANEKSDYLRLANLIHSGMTGHGIHPGFEPVRCFELSGSFADWRTCLSIPQVPGAAADGSDQPAYAVSLQSITDAASFCTAPTHSCPGFTVDRPQVSDDDRDLFPFVPAAAENGIPLGRALNSTGNLLLPTGSLLCHTTVFGATSTGKTNAVMQLLTGAWKQRRIPFAVLEAAKKEYHSLLALLPELQIFTVGVDGIPLQINPLQPEDGVLIENHVSAVVSAIAAATGAEHPIPEAFMGLLKRTYQRFGWNFGTLAYTDEHKPFPTFADVHKDVDVYIADSARYGPEVRQNLTAALKLRCETFSSGALGRIFAKPAGLMAKDFLTAPSVIELADFAEDSTSFLMNILLFRFQSYLERLPASRNLERLIVVEEAHNVFRRTLSEDSSLARSNLAFDRMFAEIRASGTGLILSDQRPALMPDAVLANTAVKICLGMDSEEDRRAIGDAMGLSDVQRRELHALQVGECLVSNRTHRGIYRVKMEKAAAGEPFSAACTVCGCRFRCRKAAVETLIGQLPAPLKKYHLAKITANPYNVVSLSANIDHMLADMHVTAAASTRLCLLGELLRRAHVPMGESRLIVSAYRDHLNKRRDTP